MPPKKSATVAGNQLTIIRTKRNIKPTEKILQANLKLRQSDTNFKRETITKKVSTKDLPLKSIEEKPTNKTALKKSIVKATISQQMTSDKDSESTSAQNIKSVESNTQSVVKAKNVDKSKLPDKIAKIDKTDKSEPTRSKRLVKPTAKAVSHMAQKKRKLKPQAEVKTKESDKKEIESKQMKPISKLVIDTTFADQNVKEVKRNEDDVAMVEGTKKEKKFIVSKKKKFEEKPIDERIKRIKKPTAKLLDSNLKLRQVESVVPEQRKKTNTVIPKPLQKPILKTEQEDVLNSLASDTTIIESVGKCSVMKQNHVPIYKHIQNIPASVNAPKDVYSLTEFTEDQANENKDDSITDVIKKLRKENKVIIKHPKKKRLIKKPFRMQKDKKNVENKFKLSNKEIAMKRQKKAIINQLINNFDVNDNNAVHFQHAIDNLLTQSTPKSLLDKHTTKNLTNANEINKPLPDPSGLIKKLVSGAASNKPMLMLKNSNSQSSKSNKLNEPNPSLTKPMLTLNQSNTNTIFTKQLNKHQTNGGVINESFLRNKVVSTFSEPMSLQLNKPMTQSTPKSNNQNNIISKPMFVPSTPITNIGKSIPNKDRNNRNLIKTLTNCSSKSLMENNPTGASINTITDDENINQLSNIENMQPFGYEKIIRQIKYLPQNINLNKRQALRNRKPLFALSSANSSKPLIEPSNNDKNRMIKVSNFY